MKVVFRQTGGIAGLVRGAEIDEDDVPPSEARKLRDLVERSGLKESFERHDERARDAQVYRIEVTSDGRRLRFEFDESSMPREAAPLVAFLQSRAGPRSVEDE
jgi:hypothetical protein